MSCARPVVEDACGAGKVGHGPVGRRHLPETDGRDATFPRQSGVHRPGRKLAGEAGGSYGSTGAISVTATAQTTVEQLVDAGRVLFGRSFSPDRPGWRATLRDVYRRRALETHPDRARALGRPEAEPAREFHAIAEAYRVLSAAARGPSTSGCGPRPREHRPGRRRPPRRGRAPHVGDRRARAGRRPRAAPAPAPAARRVPLLHGPHSWSAFVAAIVWQRAQPRGSDGSRSTSASSPRRTSPRSSRRRAEAPSGSRSASTRCTASSRGCSSSPRWGGGPAAASDRRVLRGARPRRRPDARRRARGSATTRGFASECCRTGPRGRRSEKTTARSSRATSRGPGCTLAGESSRVGWGRRYGFPPK